MGQKKNVDMSTTQTEVKIVAPQGSAEGELVKAKRAQSKKARGKKYASSRAQVDKTKEYDAFAAIELVKKLSFSKFTGSVEAHGVVKKAGAAYSLAFPHSTGQLVRVAVADDELIKKIETGQIEFDVLVAAPSFMPKLAKLARVLGPKGLMPNPKSGTLTDQPEVKKKELEGGTLTLKTEKKAPLIHLLIGKVSMDTKQLVENLNTLIKVLGPDLVKLSISASMSPGVKVKVK